MIEIKNVKINSHIFIQAFFKMFNVCSVKLDPVTVGRMLKIRKKIADQTEYISELSGKMLEKYADKDDKGNAIVDNYVNGMPKFKISDEGESKATKEMKPIFEEPFQIDTDKIPAYKVAVAELSVEQIFQLEDILDTDQLENPTVTVSDTPTKLTPLPTLPKA